jgi:hypothetical protein
MLDGVIAGSVSGDGRGGALLGGLALAADGAPGVAGASNGSSVAPQAASTRLASAARILAFLGSRARLSPVLSLLDAIGPRRTRSLFDLDSRFIDVLTFLERSS